MTLRWQFRESSMGAFKTPAAAKTAIRRLLGEALLAWGDSSPVKFTERSDAWDFEIVMRKTGNCDANGCVLASAFFPDAGRHKVMSYPEMFSQSRPEQVETLVHEIGHVFGLRHFFANISETDFPSEIFGVHKPFSIMNYGNKSKLTADDKADLTAADLLYLFCTCTAAFCRFLPIEPIEFSKSFENPKIVADRLPPPPPFKLFYPLAFSGFAPFRLQNVSKPTCWRGLIEEPNRAFDGRWTEVHVALRRA